MATSITPEGNMRIADIQVPERRRRALDPSSVRALMDSIREVGLLNPITVTKERVLVSGLHRKQACEQLGWTEIPAVVVDLDGLRKELAEIDENLVRNELSALERSDHMARRKEIYESLHPESVHGGDRRSEQARARPDQDPESGSCSRVRIIDVPEGSSEEEALARAAAPSFIDDTASKTGRSRSAIAEDVKIGRDLAPDVKDALRGTEIADNKRALLALAEEPAKRQRELAAAGPIAIKEAAKVKRTKAGGGKKAVRFPAAERGRIEAKPSGTASSPALPERVRLYIERTAAAAKLENHRQVHALLMLAIECLNASEKDLRKLNSEYEEQFIKYTV